MKGNDQVAQQTGPELHTPGAGNGHQPPAVSRASIAVIVLVVLIVAVVLGSLGVLHRVHANTELEHYTAATADPPVALEFPVLQQTGQEIVIPGNMQAFTEAPIYARTTGYVKAWYHDIGSHVHKGDLLAVIETPELDQQLSQAKADLATAQANASLAKVTANRYQDLIGKKAVSQQDTDNADAQLRARDTEVASADANVRRLEELVSFEHITAPFDGVVTARNVDIGQLITTSGSTGTLGNSSVPATREIFDIASIGTLRVFINVPQVHAPDAKNGSIATLSLPQYPNRTFQGKLVRSSDSVDPNTRTLLAEVDVNNRTGELLPGSYTEVHLHTAKAQPVLVVPISAVVLQPDGLHVAVVDKNSIAHILHVTPGRDLGASMEIVGGLPQDQPVITNPPDSLMDGQKVRVVSRPSQPGQARGAGEGQ